MRSLVLALALVLTTQAGPAQATVGPDPSKAVFEAAEAALAKRDRAGVEQALVQVDALIAKTPTAAAHYTRGWILSKLGRLEDSARAYDQAIALDPAFWEAMYNSGVVLLGLGRDPEAIARFEAAIAVDPKQVNPLYNLGQVRYNHGEFAQALDAWTRARALAPQEFDIAKKLVQTYNALGQTAEAEQARLEAIELWKTSPDPEVRALKGFVVDQFQVDAWHVYAFESLAPTETGHFYTFKLADANNKVVGSIELETSPARPAVIGVSKDGVQRTIGPDWPERPSYQVLKPVVIFAIRKQFPSTP